MKKKRSRRMLLNLALSLMALLVIVPAGSSSRTKASASTRSADSGVCMSQCHVDMSDCLGNGGGYSCIDTFYECSAGCYQLLQ